MLALLLSTVIIGQSPDYSLWEKRISALEIRANDTDMSIEELRNDLAAIRATMASASVEQPTATAAVGHTSAASTAYRSSMSVRHSVGVRRRGLFRRVFRGRAKSRNMIRMRSTPMRQSVRVRSSASC